MDPLPKRSFLISAHCLTIKRKFQDFHRDELAAIFDDVLRELNRKDFSRSDYFDSFNEFLRTLTRTPPTILSQMIWHKFFLFVRNSTSEFLRKLAKSFFLDPLELYSLRNSILLLDCVVNQCEDLTKLFKWITDNSLINEFAHCLDSVQTMINLNGNNKRIIKQMTRLLDLFANVQERVPFNFHQNNFAALFQPTINCLTSTTFETLFHNLKPNGKSLKSIEKFFLVKCPYFLSFYSGPHTEKTIDQVLKIILPRYVHLLNKHMKTIAIWTRPMMRAIHHLLNTMIFAEGCFTTYLDTRSIHRVINHLLRLIDEDHLIQEIEPEGKNLQSILINSALIILSVLVYESEPFQYLKRCQAIDIFQRLTQTPSSPIVLNAYMMLAYTMTEQDLNNFSDDFTRLLRTILSLLLQIRRNRPSSSTKDRNERTLLQLLEILRGLIQYEQIKPILIELNALPFLIDSANHFHGLAKQILLECLWTLSFDESIAQTLRQYPSLIDHLENFPKPSIQPSASSLLRRSTSFSSRRTFPTRNSQDFNNDLTSQIVDGLLWQLNRASKKVKPNDSRTVHFDVMISYSFDDKEIVQKLRQTLTKAGFHLWNHRDENQRPTLEITSNAMDRSKIIILCLSDSYKRENFCRAEAEYAASNKDRILIPILVRAKYKIDGWIEQVVVEENNITLDGEDFQQASTLLIEKIRRILSKTGHGEENKSTKSVSSIKRLESISTDSNSRPISPRLSSERGEYQIHQNLPEQYTKRDTTQSRYRSIPVNIWSSKDILDFFHDANLQPFMAICENMSGQGLIQFFRMCQSRPSRLFTHINDELRRRFNGYTLPMAIYTQFLIEMDALLGPTPLTLPPLLTNPPKIIDRPVYSSSGSQSPAVSTAGPSPALTVRSPFSPARSKLLTPIDPVSGTATPLIIERAVFRPASSVGRPYNFVVETVEEPTSVMKKVELHGAQLIFLDEVAQELRSRNVSR